MSEQITVSLPSYQWEAILRGLASSGWESMHTVLSVKLAAGVVAEEPELEYGHQCDESREAFGEAHVNDWPVTATCTNGTGYRRTAAIPAGPWVPVKQEGAEP